MSAGSGPPTMRDVARSAGVSLKTVSRVVNGETTVAPDLAARVRAAVETLNYRPHIGASLLRRNDRRTQTIGVLLTDVSQPFSAAVHRAVEDEARVRGVHVLTGSLDDDPGRERDMTRAFAMRQADGLVLAPAGPDQRHLTGLGGLPIVFVDRPAQGYAGDRVVAANVEGAASAVRHLIGHGHRRIAYLGDRSAGWTAEGRVRGYRQAMTEAGLEPSFLPGPPFGLSDPPAPRADPSAPLADPFAPLADLSAPFADLPAPLADLSASLADLSAPLADLSALLTGADSPTALFCERESITVSALRVLHHLGLQRRVAVVAFGDLELADLLDPPLTVVAQDAAAIGRAAARALFERIDGFTGPPREFRIPTALIPRGSGELPPP